MAYLPKSAIVLIGNEAAPGFTLGWRLDWTRSRQP